MRQSEVTGGYVDLQKKRQPRNSDFSFFLLLRQRPGTPCWFLQHYSHRGVSPLLPHPSSRRHGRRDTPFLSFTVSTPGSNPPPENAYLRARCNRRSSCYRPASELATSTVCFALRSAFCFKLGHQKNRKNGAIGALVSVRASEESKEWRDRASETSPILHWLWGSLQNEKPRELKPGFRMKFQVLAWAQ